MIPDQHTEIAAEAGREDDRTAEDILKDWRTASVNEDLLLAALMLAVAEANERTRQQVAEALLGQR